MKKIEDYNNGFIKNHKFELVEMNDEKVIIKAPLEETSLNPYNMAHGGFTFGLGDTAMGLLCYKVGGEAVTLNANINYIKPGTGKYLQAEATLVKKSKKICFLKTEIYNDKKELVATMESTYYYI